MDPTTDRRDPPAPGPGPGFGFPRALRLRKRAEFDRVFAAGRRHSDGRMTLLFAPNGLPHPRLGIVAGRKVGCAARRNRAKRVIREAFRLHRAALPAGFDLVVVPRPLRTGWTLEAARASLLALAARIAERGAP